MHKFNLVVSGCQTGVDQGGIEAARVFGITTGGFMTLGYKTEDGPRRDFAYLYGVAQTKSTEYPVRTKANVMLADKTLWLGDGDSLGYYCTLKHCNNHRGVMELGSIRNYQAPEKTARLLAALGVKSINIAGPRESICNGIQVFAFNYFSQVFSELGYRLIKERLQDAYLPKSS